MPSPLQKSPHTSTNQTYLKTIFRTRFRIKFLSFQNLLISLLTPKEYITTTKMENYIDSIISVSIEHNLHSLVIYQIVDVSKISVLKFAFICYSLLHTDLTYHLHEITIG